MGNEVTEQLMKFGLSIMHMLQDGKKSKGTADSLWDVIMSLFETGN